MPPRASSSAWVPSSTIRRADMILVMENGEIVERGTDETLMARQGVYYEMIQRQIQADAAEREMSRR